MNSGTLVCVANADRISEVSAFSVLGTFVPKTTDQVDVSSRNFGSTLASSSRTSPASRSSTSMGKPNARKSSSVNDN